MYIILIFIIFIIIEYILNKYEKYDNYYIPKIIWTFWDNDIIPDYLQVNVNTWKKKYPDWEVNILSYNNLNNYVDINFINKFKDKVNHTLFSDFLRLELLSKHGGLWLDIGIFFINNSFINDIYNNMILNKYDVFLYEYKKKTIDNNLPYLENWFIMSPKNSIFINDINKQFIDAFNYGFINYKFDILKKKINLSNTINNNDNNTYLMMHAIINYTMYLNPNKYNIYILDASDYMFYIQNKFDWNDNEIIDFIINNNISNLNAVKLVGNNRRKLLDNENIKNQYINKINSL